MLANHGGMTCETCFNPRTRVGCDSSLFGVIGVKQRFQSTHPRGVRRALPFRAYNLVYNVSIHAPAWGATSRVAIYRTSLDGFNPRTRVGCDRKIPMKLSKSSCFNPRTRVGCDASCRMMDVQAYRFQSTHPRGVRLLHNSPFDRRNTVSIHAPAWGATRRHAGHRPDRRVSIHAPAWGATWHFFVPNRLTWNVSIHAPAWGATPQRHDRELRLKVSIHAPAWGATLCLYAGSLSYVVSIHAPAWGATRRLFLRRGLFGVSIHAPAWGATVLVVVSSPDSNVSIHAPAWGATLW